jgi:O-antigen ligase
MRETGGAYAPPFVFLPAVLLVGVLFDGGDWPPATFLVRVSLFVAVAHFLRARDEVTVRPTMPDLLVAAFWGLAALSLFRGGYRWVTYQWILHFTAAAALYVSVRALPPDAEGRFPDVLGRTVAACAIGLSVIALFQWAVLGRSRPPATMHNPNFLAEYLVYGIGMVLAWSTGSSPGAGRGALYGKAAIVVLLLLAVAASRSGGGALLVAGVAGLFLYRWVGWRRMVPIVLVVSACLLLVPNPLLDRFAGHGDRYAFARLQIWKSALRVFSENPLGVGLGQFKYYWNMMPEPVEGAILRYGKAAQNPHNEYLSILSELGLPGAFALLAAAACGVVSLRRAFVRQVPPSVTGSVLILAISGAHAAVDGNYHVPGLLLTNAAALGVVSGHLWEPVTTRTIRLRGPVRGALLVLLAVFAAYSAMTAAAAGLEWAGYRAFGQGKFGAAERAYTLASSVDPLRGTFPDSASAAAFRLHETGGDPATLSRALEWEMEAARRNPMEYRYPARLGFLYQRAAAFFPGREAEPVFAGSLRAYDRAISLSPFNAALNYEKALLLHRLGRDHAARQQLEGILREEPRFARGWVLLGDVLSAQDRRGALAAYDKGLLLYRKYFPVAHEPNEKEFLEMDVSAVEGKASRLRAEAEGQVP